MQRNQILPCLDYYLLNNLEAAVCAYYKRVRCCNIENFTVSSPPFGHEIKHQDVFMMGLTFPSVTEATLDP